MIIYIKYIKTIRMDNLPQINDTLKGNRRDRKKEYKRKRLQQTEKDPILQEKDLDVHEDEKVEPVNVKNLISNVVNDFIFPPYYKGKTNKTTQDVGICYMFLNELLRHKQGKPTTFFTFKFGDPLKGINIKQIMTDISMIPRNFPFPQFPSREEYYSLISV